MTIFLYFYGNIKYKINIFEGSGLSIVIFIYYFSSSRFCVTVSNYIVPILLRNILLIIIYIMNDPWVN